MKIQIDKRLLRSLVGELPKTAVQLHNDYQRCVEPFAALDQIYDALCELVSDGDVLSRSPSESEVPLTWADVHKNLLAAGVPQTLYYREVCCDD